MSKKNFLSYGDAEALLAEINLKLNAIRNTVDNLSTLINSQYKTKYFEIWRYNISVNAGDIIDLGTIKDCLDLPNDTKIRGFYISEAGGNRNASYGILRAYNGHVYYYNIYGSNDLLAVYGIVTYSENT